MTHRAWPYPGSRWWKFDFHTHTPASSDYGKGADQASLREVSPRDWLPGYMRAGVDCVAVTDHNSGAWIDGQKALNWALVLGSDSHHPTVGHGSRPPGSHCTWVKMSQPSLEGLRLALIDGQGFSIRRSDEDDPFDPFALPDHFIEAVKISDARYMGRGTSARLEFNPWLNALVGGRGTGKSTVVHALRLAMRRRDELSRLDEASPARVTFNAFDRVAADRPARGGLMDSTTIQLSLMRNGIRHRLNWRRGDDPVPVHTSGQFRARTSSPCCRSLTTQRAWRRLSENSMRPRAFDGAAKAARMIEDLASQLQPEDIPDGLFRTDASEDRDAAATLQSAAEETRFTANRLLEEAQRLRTAVDTHRRKLSSSDWQAAIDASTKEYEHSVEVLRAEGVSDPNEYGRLVQEWQQLDGEGRRFESEREEQDRLLRQAQEQYQTVLEKRRAVSDLRVAFLKKTLVENRFVRIHVRPFGDDPRVIEQSLREVLGRENKVRRQIIVVTHNPNIVVNGDAEMLHALDFQAGQCRVVQSGSLQEDTMRETVCRVMEGGREAFERRYRRLGRGPA